MSKKCFNNSKSVIRSPYKWCQDRAAYPGAEPTLHRGAVSDQLQSHALKMTNMSRKVHIRKTLAFVSMAALYGVGRFSPVEFSERAPCSADQWSLEWECFLQSPPRCHTDPYKRISSHKMIISKLHSRTNNKTLNIGGVVISKNTHID